MGDSVRRARLVRGAAAVGALVVGVLGSSWRIVHASAVRDAVQANASLAAAGHAAASWLFQPMPSALASLRASLTWSAAVLVGCWVLCAATSAARRWGRPWLPGLLAVALVMVQTAVAGASLLPYPWTLWFWAVEWPGPVRPLPTGDVLTTLAQPGFLAPLALLAALAACATVTGRAAGSPVAPEPARVEPRAALLVGIPVTTLWVAAVAARALAAAGPDDGATAVATSLGGDGGLVLLVVLAAGATSGAGPSAVAPVVLAHLLVLARLVVPWAGGGSDLLLLAAALATAAVAAASAWVPVGRGLAELAAPPRPVALWTGPAPARTDVP